MSDKSRTAGSAADIAVDAIRQMITKGELTAGMRLSEERMAEQLAISRNTLREAFRVLVSAGLLTRLHNRGVSVAEFDAEAILDIYRVRRTIECASLRSGSQFHPAIRAMAQAVEEAEQHAVTQDWDAVGTANMRFHRAIVDLSDSERLGTLMDNVVAELRVVFGTFDDAGLLHAPYVGENRELLQLMQEGRAEEAAALLESYLTKSERVVLGEHRRATRAIVKTGGSTSRDSLIIF